MTNTYTTEDFVKATGGTLFDSSPPGTVQYSGTYMTTVSQTTDSQATDSKPPADDGSVAIKS
jgi:hypothetical protein